MVETQPDYEVERQISADLANRIGRGDSSAETELVKRYGEGVRFLLQRKTQDHQLAEDIWQDTFQLVIEKLRNAAIKEPDKLPGYIRGIANNLLIGHHRKTARRRTSAQSDILDAIPDHTSNPADEVSRNQISRLVRNVLNKLPVQRDREILLRYYVSDEDKETICNDLGLDSLHFNRVLFRAKKRLGELLMKLEKSHLRLVRCI